MRHLRSLVAPRYDPNAVCGKCTGYKQVTPDSSAKTPARTPPGPVAK